MVCVLLPGREPRTEKSPKVLLERSRECSQLATGKYGCTEIRVYPAECGEQMGRDP